MLAGLYACSPAPNPPPPPVNEYLVVGNDKGFRDDFINQANIVTVNDSSITVRSLKSADNFRNYPIVNGYVEGGTKPELHWRFTRVGQDTIALVDTSRATTFYLRRLNRVDSLPGTLGLLVSGELKRKFAASASFIPHVNYVFNDMGQGAGCLINRSYYPHLDWTTMRGVADKDAMPEIEYYVRRSEMSSLWRLYTRFAQPILVYKNYKNGLTVVPLDSLSVNGDTLHGHAISDRSFKSWSDFRLFRTDVSVADQLPDLLALLSAKPEKVEVLPTKVRNKYRRNWEKGEDPTDFITVYEEDLENLQLSFSGKDQLKLLVDGAEIFSASYSFHPTTPYLIVGEKCEDDAYWHYERHGDSLTFRVPLRVEMPFTEEVRTQVFDSNGKEITFPASRWYATEEWRGTYLLKEVDSK